MYYATVVLLGTGDTREVGRYGQSRNDLSKTSHPSMESLSINKDMKAILVAVHETEFICVHACRCICTLDAV
jgi:hypothetical protein